MEARVFHHQSPARWQRRNKAEEEERRKKRLEVQIISAQKLAKVHMLKKTKAYAVAWMDMHQDAKLSTDVDRRGGRNPTWNRVLSFSAAEAEELVETLGTNAALNIEIYSKSWLRDKIVGTVRVLLVDLLQGIPDKGKCFTFMVARPSGRRKGLLNVGVRPEKAFQDDEIVVWTPAAAAGTAALAPGAAAGTAVPTAAGVAAAGTAVPTAAGTEARVTATAAAAAAAGTEARATATATAAAVQQADSHRIAVRLQQLHEEMDLSRASQRDAPQTVLHSVASRDRGKHVPTAVAVHRRDHDQRARTAAPGAAAGTAAPGAAAGTAVPTAAGTEARVTAAATAATAGTEARATATAAAAAAAAVQQADSHRIAIRLQQLHEEMDLSRTSHRDAPQTVLHSVASRDREKHVPTAVAVRRRDHDQRARTPAPAVQRVSASRDHGEHGPSTVAVQPVSAPLQQLHKGIGSYRTDQANAPLPGTSKYDPQLAASAIALRQFAAASDSHRSAAAVLLQEMDFSMAAHTNAAPDSIASRERQRHKRPRQGTEADSHRIAARLQQLHMEMDLSKREHSDAPIGQQEHAPSAPPFRGYVD